MAQTDFSQPGKVELSFGFAFHQKRIADPKNRKIVADIIEAICGEQIELVCVLRKDDAPATKKDIPPEAALQDVSSVFGGGELL